jgi:2',3'-cyclic-nucleotide 2'-phosphodiesterase (5'-nucleotidase family)
MSTELVSTPVFTFNHDVPASLARNAEVAAFDNATGLIFIAAPAGVDVLTQAGSLVGTIATAALGNVNSVAAKDGVVAIAIEATPKTDPGKVLVVDVSFVGGSFGATERFVAEVGALPDMITFSPDGTTLLTANEGEPNSYNEADSVDPEGSVSIIDVATGAVTTAGFGAFNGEMDALKASGVRIFGPNATVAQDLEPEYIAVSADGATAYVTLQEANAIAVLDIASATFTDVVALGFKNHSLAGNEISANDRDNVFAPQTFPVLGMYMPDGIAAIEIGGTTYLITANEGDARDYDGLEEEDRVADLVLDPTTFPNAAALQTDAELGRLTVSNQFGDTDGDGDIDVLYAFGGRSFSVWNTDGTLVFDSGNMLDEIIATEFSALYDENRDDNKGVEPESVTVASIGGNDYLFVGLERADATIAFRIDGPTEFTFAGVYATAGDDAPEVITVIPETDGAPAVLVVPNEGSETTTAYALEETFTLNLLHHADFEGNTNAIADAPRLAALFDFFDDAPNTLKLSGGDNWIPSPWYNAQVPANAAVLKPALQAVYEELLGLPEGSLTGLALTPGAIDQAILNIIGIDASAIGNHEFDQGTAQVARIIEFAANAALSGDAGTFELGDITTIGALYPTVSANLNFTANADLGDSFTAALRDAGAFGLEDLTTSDGIAANLPANGKDKLAPFATIEVGGETIGIVGATTQRLAAISSPGTVTVEGTPPVADDMALLASQLQGEVDALIAAGVNKVILVSHLQDYTNEVELATLLSGVDIILSAGSDAIFANPSDVIKPGPGVNEPTYPLIHTGADGNPVLQVNTDGQYHYMGRLVVTFDADGVVILGSLNTTDPTADDYSGAYATTDAVIEGLYGTDDPYAAGTTGGLVKELADAVDVLLGAKLANVAGFTEVFLNGLRGDIRNQETNLGNLTADANLVAAEAFIAANNPALADIPLVSLKNGGGIRAEIGLPLGVSGPEAPIGGAVSQLDIETALAFNNALAIYQTTAQGLLNLLEHGVANAGTTSGRFPQIGGMAFSYDPDLPAGDRILSLSILGDGGLPLLALVKDGALVVPGDSPINVATLTFLSSSNGDGYPFAANRRPGTTDIPLFEPGSTPGYDTPGYEQKAFADFLAARFGTREEAFDVADVAQGGDTRIQNLNVREDTVLDGLDDGAALDIALFQTALFPGRPATEWQGALEALTYVDGTSEAQQDSAADDDSTGDTLGRFAEENGDVAVFGAEFANGVAFAADDALVSLGWENGAATLTHEAPWNAIKVLAINDFTGAALTLKGWVDVDVNLGAREDGLALTIDGTKRGSIETGAGDDTILIGADSNEGRWSNRFVIDTGAGDDSVTIDAASEAYATQSFARSFLDAFATVEITLGEGDDAYAGTGRDTAVYDVAIDDYVITALEGGGFQVEDVSLENGDEGTDTLTGVAFFRFGGTTVAADELFG